MAGFRVISRRASKTQAVPSLTEWWATVPCRTKVLERV